METKWLRDSWLDTIDGVLMAWGETSSANGAHGQGIDLFISENGED